MTLKCKNELTKDEADYLEFLFAAGESYSRICNAIPRLTKGSYSYYKKKWQSRNALRKAGRGGD